MMLKAFVAFFLTLCSNTPSESQAFRLDRSICGHGRRSKLITLAAKKHPFVVSGESLLNTGQDMLVSPAQALIRAGDAWESDDWMEVTYSCADAADAFRRADGYDSIADELQDMSEIEGCTSVGPPSSVPNLLELQSHFAELAEESGNNEFNVIANAFGDLARRYDNV